MSFISKAKRYLKHRKNYTGEKFAMVLYYLPYAFLLDDIVHGEYASVSFDYEKIYMRHDYMHDVMGFYHTHPPGLKAKPSLTDIKTMGAWQRCLGDPLWCFIDSGWEVRGYIFYNGEEYFPFPSEKIIAKLNDDGTGYLYTSRRFE